MRLIDADELLRLSHRFHISEFDRDGFEIIYADTVRNAPTVEAQKTGKWIHCKYPLGECSLCHKIINIQANEADYCPCCGSKNTGYEWL